MAAELVTRLFTSEITEALRANNSFLMYSKRDDGYVNNNSVELPHSGADPALAIDRSTFPATAVQRTDVATNYVLEEFSTTPTHLQFSEELVVAYNKRASISDGHIKTQLAHIGDRAAFRWAEQIVNTADANVPTTGTARPSTAPASTASVHALAKDDILAGKTQMDLQDVPAEGRMLLIEPSMLADILKLDEFTRMDAYGKSNLPTGWVGKIFGFDVIMRSKVVVCDATGDPVDNTTAAAATDTSAAIMWHPSFVRTAIGSIKVFLETDKPEWYGSLISTAVRFGSLRARNDAAGIVILREDTSS